MINTKTSTITTMAQRHLQIIRTVLGARPLLYLQLQLQYMDLQPHLVMDPRPLHPHQGLRTPQYLIFQLDDPQQTMVCPRLSLLQRVMVPLNLSPFQMGMANLKLKTHPLHHHQKVMECLKPIQLVHTNLQVKLKRLIITTTITIMI